MKTRTRVPLHRETKIGLDTYAAARGIPTKALLEDICKTWLSSQPPISYNQQFLETPLN